MPQVENFGVHISSTGCAVYGLRIDAIQDQFADQVSLDNLVRLLADVWFRGLGFRV